MDNRIVYLIRKASYRNSSCEKEAESIVDLSIDSFNSLILKGYNQLTAIKIILRRIKQNNVNNETVISKDKKSSILTNTCLLILLAIINCIMYFNKYLIFSDIIFVDLILINITTLYKSRKVFKKRNDGSKKELKGLLFIITINLIITILLKYDLSLIEFHSRIGYVLLIGNILYIALFNRSRLILFLSVPSALISVMLINQSISITTYTQTIIFIYIAYLLYVAFSIKFIYLHNLVLGFFSMTWSLLMFLFNINYYSIFVFSFAFLILSILIVKRLANDIYLSDYKSIITFNILSIVGFLMISIIKGYIDSTSFIGEINIFDQKTLIFILFLVLLEVINSIVFNRFELKKHSKHLINEV